MFLALWNYIRGYVIIYVTGFSVERFINLVVNRGIFVLDIVPERNRIVMKASVKDADELRECGIKTGCRFEIADERGLPVFLRQCASRKAYAGGILAFAIVMYIMSSFIWTVRVEGTDRLNSEDIIESCANMGISPGRLKYGLDLYEAGERLMMEYKDISWIAVNLKGTKITVSIVETIPESQYVEREIPTDVVADSDGIITSIVASAGTPVVHEGDEVKKGDVLISCAVPLKDGENQTGEIYVCASGEVFAKKQYELEGISPLNYNEKVFTGKTKTDYSVSIGSRTFNFITPSMDMSYESISNDVLAFDIGDYRVPFCINKSVYEKQKTEIRKRTEEEAQNLAEKQLRDKVSALTMESGGELSRLDTNIQTDSQNVTVKGYAEIIMRIDKQRETQVPEIQSDKGGTADATDRTNS